MQSLFSNLCGSCSLSLTALCADSKFCLEALVLWPVDIFSEGHKSYISCQSKAWRCLVVASCDRLCTQPDLCTASQVQPFYSHCSADSPSWVRPVGRAGPDTILLIPPAALAMSEGETHQPIMTVCLCSCKMSWLLGIRLGKCWVVSTVCLL